MMWLILALASCFELAFTVCMKLSCGYQKKGYSILTVLATGVSIFLLSIATKELPLGPAYAVWTGLGTILTVTFGIIFFKESRSPKKLFFLGLLFIGVIGLRFCNG